MTHDKDGETQREPNADEQNESLNEAEALVDLVLAAHEARVAARIETPARVDGVVIGRLVGLDQGADVLVDWPGCPVSGGQKARVMTSIAPNDVGRGVALLFEGGDPAKPVVMGLLFQGHHAAVAGPTIEFSPDGAEAIVDGERVVISAEKDIVLQCGKASITLTRAGKIILRGEYVSSRASGVHRIQGGSVQIN